ncbi:MAG: LemA family protein [Clostridia bacterium]|nr:LemA family protein [Clostridia bacterium]
MKKSTIVILVIVGILVLAVIWGISTNNSLVRLEESIVQKQSEIDNQLKRRADLIPNLVNSVKGLTKQEQAIVDSITASREKMSTGSTQDKLNANTELSKNITFLVENYPEIKSDAAFTSLMDELSGTENRISVARKNYNDEVAVYNKQIKIFPSSVIAGMFNHEKAEYLQVTEEEKQNPEVKF